MKKGMFLSILSVCALLTLPSCVLVDDPYYDGPSHRPPPPGHGPDHRPPGHGPDHRPHGHGPDHRPSGHGPDHRPHGGRR